MPTKATHYEFDYTSVYCIDWGGLGHDMGRDRGSVILKFKNDKEALAEATSDKYRGRYRCSGYACDADGHSRILHGITKVTTTRNGDLETITRKKLKVPYPRQCDCGKTFWPARGESACHKLVPVS